MDAREFEQQLAAGGFDAALAKEYEPSRVNESHAHPFDVMGLVLSGQMSVVADDSVQSCGPGDVFVMSRGTLHKEVVGSEGVRYLAGRRGEG